MAFAVPALLFIVSQTHRSGPKSNAWGHLLSSLVALGLVAIVFEVLMCIYLSKKGTDLMNEVPYMALLSPLVFGLGTLWTATRIMPFSELKRFPLLRRVWATLSLAAVLLGAFLILKHTYLVVFSGILGFLIVALVGWTLIRKLVARVTESAPPDGDPDLVAEVIADSRAEARRLAEQIAHEENAQKKD
jgi:hypothetical protein